MHSLYIFWRNNWKWHLIQELVHTSITLCYDHLFAGLHDITSLGRHFFWCVFFSQNLLFPTFSWSSINVFSVWVKKLLNQVRWSGGGGKSLDGLLLFWRIYKLFAECVMKREQSAHIKRHKALREQVSSEWPKAGSLYVLGSVRCWLAAEVKYRYRGWSQKDF